MCGTGVLPADHVLLRIWREGNDGSLYAPLLVELTLQRATTGRGLDDRGEERWLAARLALLPDRESQPCVCCRGDVTGDE